MKAITATVSFTIKNRFYKEDLDEQLESYKEEIETLLDYDCDVYNPIKEEDTDECVSFSFPVDAYVEIIDEKDQIEGEEKIKEEAEGSAVQLQTILEDGLRGDILVEDIQYTSKSFKDIYAYKDWVMEDSIITLLNCDNDFEESFPSLIMDRYDTEITGIHKGENGIYVQGFDDEGERFNLALKYVKEFSSDEITLLEKHMAEMYPSGNQYYLLIVEEGDTSEDWTRIDDSEEDIYGSFYKAISLRDIEENEDSFYAADSLLCCIDNEYESKIDEDYYD